LAKEDAPCADRISVPVRKYAAEQGIGEEEALKKGMEEKSRDFAEKGSAVYAKAWPAPLFGLVQRPHWPRPSISTDGSIRSVSY